MTALDQNGTDDREGGQEVHQRHQFHAAGEADGGLEQAYDALKSFAYCIARHESPESRDRFVHMDILTRMNIDNY